jgi:AAA15 family ATPase/GTPase
VLYGANASGKSNLIKAMSMAQKLLLRPAEIERPIPRVPFKLDAACMGKPSRFEFEIKVNDRYYSYGFSVTSKRVEEEWLFVIDQEPDRRIFERTRGKIELPGAG